MSTPRVRPEFELVVPFSCDEVVVRVKAALRCDAEVRGLFARGRIELVPDPAVQHFWSPQLEADIEACPASALDAPESTHVRVRFAPHPHVWSFYVAVHALGALATLGAGIFGFSQYLAGGSPWALWALPASPVLAALVWALAFVGQGLSAEQMYALRRFLERALEDDRAAVP
ncbi:MAG: hypothetical protein GXP55_19725 [Deltaproteobacteria bacterium]|nr:hypothetical protein [Deltaproteobacteria bacterium]